MDGEAVRAVLEELVGTVVVDVDAAVAVVAERLLRRGIGGNYDITVEEQPDGGALLKLHPRAGAGAVEAAVRLAPALRVVAVEVAGERRRWSGL